MVAKTMALSLLWYHTMVIPWMDSNLREMEKTLSNFVWREGLVKVANSHIAMDNDKKGIWL